MKLKIKRLHLDAKLPSYAHPWDAGLDICTTEETTILPGERKMLPTGLSFEIPEGYVGLVWDKSGLAKNHGITNLAGVIDSGFRGECMILSFNSGSEPHTFHKGDKVAQILIQSINHFEIEEIQELSQTSRGEGGWGSTGKQ